MLAGAIGYFRYLKVGLSLVLVFIGVKMLLDPHDRQPPRWFQVEIPTGLSLLVVAGILFLAMAGSLVLTWREKTCRARTSSRRGPPPR